MQARSRAAAAVIALLLATTPALAQKPADPLAGTVRQDGLLPVHVDKAGGRILLQLRFHAPHHDGVDAACQQQDNSILFVFGDTSLRDGLQSIARTVPTDLKLQWLQALHAAGLRQIEVGSFVPPRLLPQLADSLRRVRAARQLRGVPGGRVLSRSRPSTPASA